MLCYRNVMTFPAFINGLKNIAEKVSSQIQLIKTFLRRVTYIYKGIVPHFVACKKAKLPKILSARDLIARWTRYWVVPSIGSLLRLLVKQRYHITLRRQASKWSHRTKNPCTDQAVEERIQEFAIMEWLLN